MTTEFKKYRIVRFYERSTLNRHIIRDNMTLDEVTEWCNNPETSSKTAKRADARERTKRCGPWFDGYEQY